MPLAPATTTDPAVADLLEKVQSVPPREWGDLLGRLDTDQRRELGKLADEVAVCLARAAGFLSHPDLTADEHDRRRRGDDAAVALAGELGFNYPALTRIWT